MFLPCPRSNLLLQDPHYERAQEKKIKQAFD
jgi:hypothetical protein